MKVLIACEWSGTVGLEFAKKKHEVWTCDLEPSEKVGFAPFLQHFQGDVRYLISEDVASYFDLMIAFPPCTYLCSSGLHHNRYDAQRQAKTDDAFDFFMDLWDAPIPSICIENPVGCVSTLFRPPDQYVQPYQFGEDASKKTGLWLKNLPLLEGTDYVEPRIVDGKKRWSNQTDSGQNRLGPSKTRAKERGRTYLGIAKAMADQWSVI